MGTFDTTTAQLLLLVDWLTEHEVAHTAMERTGVLRKLTALLAPWGGHSCHDHERRQTWLAETSCS